jgi:hypothetical protein
MMTTERIPYDKPILRSLLHRIAGRMGRNDDRTLCGPNAALFFGQRLADCASLNKPPETTAPETAALGLQRTRWKRCGHDCRRRH